MIVAVTLIDDTMFTIATLTWTLIELPAARAVLILQSEICVKHELQATAKSWHFP